MTDQSRYSSTARRRFKQVHERSRRPSDRPRVRSRRSSDRPQSVGALAIVALLALASPALAQQRPLTTEDPEPVGAGRVLVEGGLDYARSVEYPASGLQGNLLRLPLLGVSIGIS